MKLLVGVDEAGYGPNLGPLVVVAVSLEVSAGTQSERLWERLAPAVNRFPAANADSIIVDDSKKVYSSGKGLEHLERTALAWIGLSGKMPLSLRELWATHCLTESQDIEECTSYARRDLTLPHLLTPDCVAKAGQVLAGALDRAGFGQAQVNCQIIMPRRFNELVRLSDSKGVALFQANAGLLRHIWNISGANQVEVMLDKHGGRNFYRPLLQQEFHETLVLAGREGPTLSQYTVSSGGRKLQATFIPRADAQHLLVAAASMVAKYLRELWMELFNACWTDRISGLRPTAGYPVDAQRFWKEIQPHMERLGIAREMIWRER